MYIYIAFVDSMVMLMVFTLMSPYSEKQAARTLTTVEW